MGIEEEEEEENNRRSPNSEEGKSSKIYSFPPHFAAFPKGRPGKGRARALTHSAWEWIRNGDREDSKLPTFECR